MIDTNKTTNFREQLVRRAFLQRALGAGAAAAWAWHFPLRANAAATGKLRAGEGVVDITPPLGIELAGFHRHPGSERRITEIRQPSAARALVLQVGQTQMAIVSLDMLATSPHFTQQVQQGVAAKTGIPAAHVRVCVTHTHSMPTFFPLLQWGAVDDKYQQATLEHAIEAVALAQQDLADAEFYYGQSRADGGNFNRTIKTWRGDDQFTKDSTDADRWLDTLLQVLRFERTGKPDLLWYHFSSHPVCYGDGGAGPDWVGITAELVRQKHGVTPAFLQGHCGDVNPGDGVKWIGEPQASAQPVADAIDRAIAASQPIAVDEMRLQATSFDLPLDIARLKHQIERYRDSPEVGNGGEYVDADFAKAWFENAQRVDLSRMHYPMPLSALRLGGVGLLFHPSELYSYYGLRIRHDSPLPHTLVAGYADDFVGYLADPNAYQAGEYAAVVTPKILDIPPFTSDAAQQMTTRVHELLQSIT